MEHGACLIQTGHESDGCYSVTLTIPFNGKNLGVYLHWHEGQGKEPNVRVRALDIVQLRPERPDDRRTWRTQTNEGWTEHVATVAEYQKLFPSSAESMGNGSVEEQLWALDETQTYPA